MITNLVASVVIGYVTNVTEVSPTSFGLRQDGDAIYTVQTEATNKTVVTKIEKVTAVCVEYHGHLFSSENRETISETEQSFALKREWVKQTAP